MSMPRTPIAALRLQGNMSNLRRAIKRGPQKPLAKRQELEVLFANIQERYELALAAVKQDGAVIWQDCWKGPKVIRIQVLNPNLKVVQQCERQLLALAKALTALPETADEKDTPKPTALEELDTLIEGVN